MSLGINSDERGAWSCMFVAFLAQKSFQVVDLGNNVYMLSYKNKKKPDKEQVIDNHFANNFERSQKMPIGVQNDFRITMPIRFFFFICVHTQNGD